MGASPSHVLYIACRTDYGQKAIFGFPENTTPLQVERNVVSSALFVVEASRPDGRVQKALEEITKYL